MELEFTDADRVRAAHLNETNSIIVLAIARIVAAGFEDHKADELMFDLETLAFNARETLAVLDIARGAGVWRQGP